MWEAPISLCEQYYEASLILLAKFGDEPKLEEFQIRQFMQSPPYRDWLYTEIIRIAIKQNYFPESEYELTALNGYANIMAEVMFRGIYKPEKRSVSNEMIEWNCDFWLRQN